MDSEERDPKLDKHLDEWLDDALAGYSKADPRPGLEQRITATLRAEDRAPARRRWWIFLTPAAAALAVLAVTVSLLHQKQGITPTPQKDASSTEIAKNEPQSSDVVTEKDGAAAPEKAIQAARPERESGKVQPPAVTAQASSKAKQNEARRAASPAEVSGFISSPSQSPTRIAPPASLPAVAEAKPAVPAQLGGAIGGTIARNDSVATLNAPAKEGDAAQHPSGRTYQALNTAPVPPPPLAKSESEPRDASRQYEYAPQIAATSVRPEKKSQTETPPPSAANETVEVSAAAPVVDTNATEVRSNQAAAAKAAADKGSLAKMKVAPAEFYKLDFVLRELEDGKVVNTRNYTLTARSGDWQQIRVDGPVTADANEVITLLLNCRIVPGTDDNATLTTIADITSTSYIARRSAKSDGSAPPVHRVQMNTNALITLGKPTVLSAADESNSKRRFELVVTVKKAK